jgi:hypothetical protein
MVVDCLLDKWLSVCLVDYDNFSWVCFDLLSFFLRLLNFSQHFGTFLPECFVVRVLFFQKLLV